jgi:hypothetical protein
MVPRPRTCRVRPDSDLSRGVLDERDDLLLEVVIGRPDLSRDLDELDDAGGHVGAGDGRARGIVDPAALGELALGSRSPADRPAISTWPSVIGRGLIQAATGRQDGGT